MSDSYSGSIKEFVLDRDAAARKSVGYIESSPDDAARALELEQATGVNSSAIAGDLEGFEKRTKSQMAGDIVRNNNYVADYINSHPLAAQLSNDDLGNLDAASQKLSVPYLSAPANLGHSAIEGFTEGFKKGFGDQPWGSWAEDQDHKLLSAIAGGVGAIPEVGLRTLSGVFQGLIDAAVKGSETGYQQAGGSESGAKSFSRAVGGIGEMLTTAPNHLTPEVGAKVEELQRDVKSIEPYLRAGKEPPIGVNPKVDDLKIEHSKAEVDALMNAIKESQGSLTKERSPDMYQGFVEQHVGDQSIGIYGDAVRGLYGDKLSAWDDAMLGFVPKLEDKLAVAEATGGYVDVPMADYIAKVEPEVAKALEDFTRVRAEGVSKGEAKDIKASAAREDALPPEKAVETVRDAAALSPSERKIALERVQDTQRFASQDGAELIGGHAFEITRGAEKMGELFIGEENGGKRLYVDDIRGIGQYGPNSLGPRQMRDLLRQLKEEFPNAEELTGFRVSGARDKAGSWEKTGKVSIKLAEPTASDNLFQLLLDDRIERLGEQHELDYGYTADTIPEDRWQNFERSIVKKIDAELSKLNVSDVDVEAVHKLQHEGNVVRGAYFAYENARPTILFALTADDPVGVLRHEVMHDLKTRGFLNVPEWATLEKAALAGDWIGKHDIEGRYESLKGDEPALLEEAIADEFADWRRNGQPADMVYAKIFQKINQLIEAIRAVMRQAFGTENWKDIFDKIESGEVAGREPGNEFGDVTKEAKPTQPELPGTRRMEDRDVFAEAQAAGMTKDQYLRYMKLIAERHREDLRVESERALKDQKQKQTAEWKENYSALREKVVEEVNAQPAVATDNLLREQRLFGRKTDSVQLGSEFLTPEQKAALPKEYIAKGGINPDDLAGLTGFNSGQELVAGLSAFDAQRKASGLRPIEFTRRLIATETERQMEAKYGRLQDNILDQAKEQVLSETQLDLLHEEVLAAGLKAGTEFPVTKDQMKSWMGEKFEQLEAKDISSDKFIADAGRAGRAAEEALLKADPAEAFKQKQRQYRAVIAARLAKDFEKAQEEFDKTAKRYTSREIGGASQEYTNAIHSMMTNLGLPVRRSVQDIAEEMRKDGFANLNEFVSAKEAALRDLHVPDWVLEGGKKYEDLTVEERKGLFDAMKALTHNSRDELKVTKAGEKFDLDQTIDQMVEQIKSLGEPKEYPIDRKESLKEYGKSWWWSGINVESMLNRLDRDRSSGIFNQFIVRHFTEASNYKDKLIRDFQGKIAEIGKIPDMDKVVDNPLFIDPITGEKFKLRRRNVLGILQNVGNENNLMKLAKGYKVEPEQLMAWLHNNTAKEDWDRAQKIGDTFKEIYKLADNMSYNVSGVGIQALPLKEVSTPYGNYAGWYNPVKYDSLRPGESKKLLGPNALEQEGFYRATTPQGYTKTRTGYAAPVELNLDVVPMRMRQMLHDIAMRPAVLQLSKIFYNPKFERAMISYYGKHQAKEMIPFLHDIANSANFKSLSASYGDQALEFFRQNTIATLIGFNPGTVMKHGATAAVNSLTEVGMKNFAREFTSLLSDTPEGRSNWSTAMDKSEELQRRMRNYSELIEGHGSEINIKGAKGKFASYRDWMMQAGATPVSVSDLLSAVPTWLAQYKKTLAAGADEGQSVFEADRAVRHAHGSSVLSNRPSISRTNALGSWFSSLYGFFSHMQQKQYELAWKAKDFAKDAMGKGSGDEEAATRHAPDLLKGFISYVVFPAMIEEMVTPYSNSDKDSWGVKAAKTLTLGVGSSLIGVRDFINSIVNVREPQAGLAATTFKFAQDLPKDFLSKQPMSKDRAASVLHHTFSTVGVLTGLTNNTEGSIAQYLYRYNHGLEHPKGPLDIFSGLRHGKTKH